ncbi:hypothetical protein [Bacillus timonensis]|uniref:hypothetical protein n=1 Tax=Bacillus timonensis TaxID=1033734 RepID=UPI000287E1BE|nr:hypothetical protein [Bacillus timonensis]
MKKIVIFLLVLTIGFVLTACGTSQNELEESNQGTTESLTKETSDNTESPVQKESKEVEQEEQTDEGFLLYRPEVGAKKVFTENGEVMFTEEVIATNDEYVQIVIDLGGNKTLQIYRWTKDEIALVLEENEELDPYENQLDSFNAMKDPDVFISNKENADWKVVETGVELEVPYGSFKDVYVFQKVTDEVEGADTIYTKYFAPAMGLVKDGFELTGEAGYKGESSLEKVE